MNASLLEVSQPKTPHVVWLERIEGAVLLVAAVLLYHVQSGNWLLFALLLLAPDLSALGFLVHHHSAALAYNLAHSVVFPALLAGYGVLTGNGLLVSLALIWCAHIGMDRMLGYAFKEVSASPTRT